MHTEAAKTSFQKKMHSKGKSAPSSSKLRIAGILACSLLAVSALTPADARMQHVVVHNKRQQLAGHDAIIKRQLLGGAGDPGTQQSAGGAAGGAADDVSSANAAASTPAGGNAAASSTTNPLDTVLNPITGAASSTSSVGPVTAQQSSSSVTSRSSAADDEESSSSARARSSTQSVINVTSTALITPSDSQSASASASASADAQKQDDDDNVIGGLSKTALIILIAIASTVGLIAAAWTIFRKWKLSPSRQFEDKLNPIEWTPEMHGAHANDDKAGLVRSNSNGSGVSSLHKSPAYLPPTNHLARHGSWGSNNGSNFGSRDNMSEVAYNAPPLPPAYPPVGSAYNAYPAYADQMPYHHHQQQQRNPYEQVSRMPTNGGRYGEGYH